MALRSRRRLRFTEAARPLPRHGRGQSLSRRDSHGSSTRYVREATRRHRARRSVLRRRYATAQDGVTIVAVPATAAVRAWTGIPMPFARSRPLRDRRRRERLLDEPDHARALALRDRSQAAELEPRELDPALRAHRPESEVGQEVARKDRAVDDEALVGGLALRDSGRRRPRAPSRPCRAPRRSPPGRATARPTALRSRRGRRTSRAPHRRREARREARRRAGRDRRGRTGSSRAFARRRPGRARPRHPSRPRPSRSSAPSRPSVAPRDCHQTHSWQTLGARTRVAPVSPATRGGAITSILGRAP